ncbi:MAG: ABC transporter permease [Armatimonadetes bacterium]|nr:ABC transporter permease [Armatimonadota bacterium]
MTEALGNAAVRGRDGKAPRFATLAARRLRRNRPAVASLLFLALVHVFAFLVPALPGFDPFLTDPGSTLAAPGGAHPLGTDEVGRDVLSRLIDGARVSLVVGLLSMALAISTGTIIGALAGYFGGFADAWLMRATDAMMALPTLFLILAIVAVFGGGPFVVMAAIGLTSWMQVARIVRGETLRWRVAEFVDAARALGASDGRIMRRHLLPQVAPAIIVTATLGVAYAILTESALSYLGVGIRPPTPSWGNMLQNAQQYIWSQPRLAIYPGVLILLTVLSYNFMGDGLRDALDPSLRNV